MVKDVGASVDRDSDMVVHIFQMKPQAWWWSPKMDGNGSKMNGVNKVDQNAL